MGFIFEKAPFPSCHASTVVETEPGTLIAAWFGGKEEGAKDVQIWGSTFNGKRWTPPVVVGSEPGQPCWNPVLFKTKQGTLYLWYKAGPSPTNWIGYMRRSADNGKSWTRPELLPASFYGPVRAKPIQLPDGAILAGTSVEAGEAPGPRVWTPFVDRSIDDGLSWARSSTFNVPNKHGQIQPTLFRADDGRVVALMRSRNPLNICRAESKDGGRLFMPARPTTLPNPSAGIDVVKTKEGDVFLIYNPTTFARTPISLARSTDDGEKWKKVEDLETEPGEYSYPAIIQSADGMLQITYTWKRTHIKHVTVDPAKFRG